MKTSTSSLLEKAARYLQRLCLGIPTRRVGSAGNQAATAFFADAIRAYGFATELTPFGCMDWTQEGAQLVVGGVTYEASVSPYSPGCQLRAPLRVITTVEELEAATVSGQIVLLCGEIAREQLMPKNFPFYNPDHHRRIVRALEHKQPQAIIAATGRDAMMAGAVYPCPLIEDGDFDIPSVYLTEEVGERLAGHAGEPVSLTSHARRSPATGYNVVARKQAEADLHVVLTAHIDAKDGTPGALDNAAGVVTLLLLAELLAAYSGQLGVEIVALNGEDYYSNPGEQLYLQLNAERFEAMMLGINLDGLGYIHGNTAYSVYEAGPELAQRIRKVFAPYATLMEGPAWYQGDHSLFLLKHRPALALTSERVTELMTTIVHSSRDLPELVDPNRLVQAALALGDLLLELNSSANWPALE